MILIADSSALIALAICEKLYILEKIFETVYVPEGVYKEVSHPDKYKSKILTSFLHDKVKEVDISEYISTDTNIGDGELQAMILYKQLNADMLLIDDRKAKRIAKVNNINVIGSLGILLVAKQKKLIKKLLN